MRKTQCVVACIATIFLSARLEAMQVDVCAAIGGGALSPTELKAAEILAKKGDPDAQARVGQSYLREGKNPISQESGIALLKMSASAGSKLGQYLLGRFYAVNGISDSDFKAALKWLENSVSADCVSANFYIGVLHLSGKGAVKDASKGYHLVSIAAEGGFVPAQLLKGTLLVTGDGVEKDQAQGFLWIKRAAESGDSAPKIALANLYISGIGTRKDVGTARDLLEGVYKRDDDQASAAAYVLGWMYMEPGNLEVDNVKAFRWMLIAANARFSDSESRVNQLIERLPKKNLIEACKVYSDPSLSTVGRRLPEAVKDEVVVIVSTKKDYAEVFFQKHSILGFVSPRCIESGE